MSKHKRDNLDEAVDEVEKLIDIAYEELKQRRQTTTEKDAEQVEASQKAKSTKGKKKRRKLSPLAKSIVVGEILNRKF